MNDKLKKLWSKRWLRRLTYLFAFVLLLFIFRTPLLRGLGNWLVAKDELMKTEACFILGGNSYERGMEAVKIYWQFSDQQFVCTGGNYPLQIRALLDSLMSEAELSRHLMMSKGVPLAQINIMEGSRSTMDESQEILNYCKQKNLKDITVVSSSFHLRRVRWVFEEKFADASIKVHFHGSNPEDYNSSNWWHNEEGLIMANNECVKLFYYLLKY
ncbi:MAG: YdcF family protein [Flavobacteriales bacterium]